MKDIAPIIVIGALIIGVVMLVRLITEYKLKKRLIEKAQADEGLSSALADSFKMLNRQKENNPYPSLKWGLVTFGVGIALISAHFLEFERHGILPFGLVLTGASAGFLIYYLLVVTKEKKS